MLCGSLLAVSSASGQTDSAKAFGAFAAKFGSLFQNAYTRRDTGAAGTLVRELLNQYGTLDSTGRKTYSANIAGAYYNLCCTYSLVGDKQRALVYLEKSIIAGYVDYQHMQVDTDLDSIRSLPRFHDLVESTRPLGDYLYILRHDKTYNDQDRRYVSTFTYQSPNDSPLVALRRSFALDSIAGGGNDVSKILNLLHWMHNLVRHDGNNSNPPVRNTAAMITVCRKENRGLNCRGLAIALNECLLSMGYASRYVTCLPKDSLGTDQDCHVIDMVFVPSLKKWIWVDPTFDAYVMNEKGELLGIAEVRERLIDGRPLILNPDANWNHKESTVKEEYLFRYMAKNLYMLACPVHSGWNLETEEKGKVIEFLRLAPSEYFKQQLETVKGSPAETQWLTHMTNNEKLFWQVP